MEEYPVYLPPFDYELSRDRLYGVWRNMLMRCYNPKTKSYHRYGGRGISVCDDWRLDFQAFKDWALAAGYDYTAPRGQCTIDRTNNDGNYCPENCRWVTIRENIANRGRSGRHPKLKPEKPKKEREPHKPKKERKLLTWEIDGVIKPAAEWCREYGINYTTATARVKYRGMTPYQALTAEKVNYYALKFKCRRRK